MSLSNLVELKTFNVFPEYFIGISALYILVVVVLITYNVYGLIVQKAISECMGLILLLACYLILNDDLIFSANGFELYSVLGFYKSTITDYFAFFTKFVVCFFSALYFFIIADFLKEYKLTSFEYLLVLLFSILGLMLLCSSNDLLTAYLSIELISLSSYVLAAFKKTSSYSAEAGVKYLVTGAISSAFFLLGSSFMYAYSGTINISDFWVIMSDEGWFSDSEALYLFEPLLEIGMTFIVFSLFIKLALAPFHVWSLDVYEGSPTISTFFFAVITKLSFFVFLVRISYVAALKYYEAWQFYGIVIALFSVFVGSFGGLRQRKLKTLLAYSSVSHMGYALLAFSAGSRFGAEMLLFYLVIYMLSGLGVWFIILATRINRKRYTDKFSKELGDLALLRKSNPALAISLALTMFSIAGIPPLVGFFAKMGVFLSILHAKYYFVALLAILCSVVSTFYYIRIIKILYFENLLVGKLYYPITTSKSVLFSVLIFSLLFLFVNPAFLYLLVYKVILCSFSGDTLSAYANTF
jgi:NADH-quinone oxidoreductase subunit N